MKRKLNSCILGFLLFFSFLSIINIKAQSLDLTPPQWSDPYVSTTLAGAIVGFTSTWMDTDGNLSYIIFSTNMSGTWMNETFPLSEYGWNSATITIFTILPSTSGVRVEWKIYCNDTSNNWNVTSLQYFTTSSPVDALENLVEDLPFYLRNRLFIKNRLISYIDNARTLLDEGQSGAAIQELNNFISYLRFIKMRYRRFYIIRYANNLIGMTQTIIYNISA
jgi:hypothetical protein